MEIVCYTGTVILIACDYTPAYSCKCDGQLLNITDHSDLFSLLSTKFGGDGVKTFALPNMMGLEPIPGLNYIMEPSGIYPQRP
jgi:microcystin-dependent protein